MEDPDGLPLTNRHAHKMLGVMLCFDRIIVVGTFPQICRTGAMVSFLTATHIRLFDLSSLGQTST
ncbi:MAG: hypothetical protein H7829_11745 [Magnetococcus sp. THC-1_WYH]